MTGEQVVKLIDRFLSQAQQHTLNDIRSTILLQTWEGSTYGSIADRLAYDLDYIKQKLLLGYRNFSLSCLEKISAKAILSQY
jgi:hypothetical protein